MFTGSDVKRSTGVGHEVRSSIGMVVAEDGDCVKLINALGKNKYSMEILRNFIRFVMVVEMFCMGDPKKTKLKT